MPAVFPALRSGVVGMYPSTLGVVFATQVVQFVNDSEQRWSSQAGLGNFELTFTNINGYDLSILLDFFRSVKGAFDTTWTLTMNGSTHTNCTFLQDDFTWTESTPEHYTLTLQCRQVQ